MAWVYILRGSSGRYYIGSTENLTRRLAEHRCGGNHTPRRLGPELRIVIIRMIDTEVEARRIEFDLKQKESTACD